MLTAYSNLQRRLILKIFHDFTTPEYQEALITSIGNGFMVVLGMLIVGAIFTLLGGGLAAKWTKKEPAHHH